MKPILIFILFFSATTFTFGDTKQEDSLQYDKAKIIKLLKKEFNMAEGKEYEGHKISFGFIADQNDNTVDVNVIANSNVITIYTIDIKKYKVIGLCI